MELLGGETEVNHHSLMAVFSGTGEMLSCFNDSEEPYYKTGEPLCKPCTDPILHPSGSNRSVDVDINNGVKAKTLSTKPTYNKEDGICCEDAHEQEPTISDSQNVIDQNSNETADMGVNRCYYVDNEMEPIYARRKIIHEKPKRWCEKCDIWFCDTCYFLGVHREHTGGKCHLV